MSAESTYRYALPIRIILVLAYIAGLVGLQVPAVARYFNALTALNLLATLAVLLYFHTDWRPSFYFYIALAVLTGFFVEVVGVHTGSVFGGPYAYGAGLGPTFWGVPPVIGVNWLLLTYCFGSLADKLPLPIYMKAILAATGMVLLDFLIEPVAIRLDFWTWFNQPIPLQNYLGWWLVALVLLSVWYGLPFRKENRVVALIISLQAFFFIGHNLLYYLQN